MPLLGMGRCHSPGPLTSFPAASLSLPLSVSLSSCSAAHIMPGRFFSVVSPRTRTPLHAVCLIVVVASLLNLIGIGSTQTIIAIFNITAPALDISYASVILARNIYSHRITFVPGPYQLGIWRKPLNTITILWVAFISVVLFFPPIRPVTKENMNYAIAVGATIVGGSWIWWWAGARKYVNLLPEETEDRKWHADFWCRTYTGPILTQMERY